MGGAKEGTDLLGKYNPGLGAQSFDVDGSAKFVPKGSDLVFNLHYTSVGTPQTDRSKVGLVFAKQPPKTRYWMSPGTPAAFNLVIPAGDNNAEVVSEVTVGVDGAKLVYIQPHMHLRGKDYEVARDLSYGRIRDRLQRNLEFRLADWIPAREADARAQRHEHPGHRALRQFGEQQVQSRSDQDDLWGDQNWDEMQSGFLGLVFDAKTDANKVFIPSGPSLLPRGTTAGPTLAASGAR